MESELWRLDTKKAMAYDLCVLMDADSSKESYTKEEIKNLIKSYVTTSGQK